MALFQIMCLQVCVFFQSLQIQSINLKLRMSDPRKEENFEFLAADDPLYANLQEKFKQQYLKREEQLQLEFQEAKSRRKQIQQTKQEVGVRLYTAQQQLASNQMDYERAHDNFNIAQRLRIEAEQKLSQVNQMYNAKKEQAGVLRNKVTKAQKQLQNLMRHYHQIQTYNVQLKSDIAVTKKQTFTAEDNVVNLEKIKKKQDLLIDSMNEQSKRMEEQKNILTAQIISQKEETEQAKKILAQAQAEMEKVVTSKKSLLQRWQKSIMMMQKRDSAVQTAKQRLQSEKQVNALLLNELSGLKTEIRKEEEQTEKLGAQSTMIGKIKATLDIIFSQLKAEQEKVSAQLLSLKQSLNNTEQNIKVTNQQQKIVEQAMNQVQTNIMKLHTQTKKLYESLIDQKSEHTTIQKTASNLLKQAQKIAEDIEQKEMQLENIMNEIARIKIDQLNTKSQIELLAKKKEEALAEQNDKKYLVITYEVQIKQGHDINQKKQHQVGRLNKLHDQLMSKANDQGKNPQENKLINLVRESEQLETRCNELYREWIKKQTILVHQNNKLQQIHQSVVNLQNKKMIMQQKKQRLNISYKNFEKEIAEIKINLKGLQQEMNKLNDNIAENTDKRQKLENENVNLQSEFIEKLKEMEHEAAKLEYNIDIIREEKAELMQEITECERQILLWERKYQLEKEMQEALDPNVGQSQIEQLKAEIHRMELRYSSLLKQQAKIVAEAERAIDKKQQIQMKYFASMKKDTGKQKIPATSNQLKTSLKMIKENQNKIMKSLQDTEKLLARKENQLQKVAQNIEESLSELRSLQNESLQLDSQRVLTRINKNVGVLLVSALQKKYKKMEEIMNKTAKLMFSEPILRQKLTDLKQKNRSLVEAVQQMGQKYIQYSELLAPLLQVQKVTANLLVLGG